MEAILNLLWDLGVLGSAALLLWGMVCAMLRFGDGRHRPLAGPRDHPIGDRPVNGSPDPALEPRTPLGTQA